MILHKYYSLDECTEPEKVYNILNDLQDDLKIEYEEIDMDLIKIVDMGLTINEAKSLATKLSKYDVIRYSDLEDEDEEEEDEDSYDTYY